MEKGELRILLLQARTPAMADHEYSCILKKGGLSAQQVERHNMPVDPVQPYQYRGFDAVMIGGSGDYCVSDHPGNKDLAWLDGAYMMMRNARAEGVPMLGICFGAHMMTSAFGGTVLHDPENMEAGTYVIDRLPDAHSDTLFFDKPDEFDAQCGRKDMIAIPPKGAVVLARSKRASIHAYSLGTNMYAIQFHPELDKEDLAERLEYYRNLYVDEGDVLKAVIDASRPTPIAARFVGDFIDRILLPRPSASSSSPGSS